MIRVLALLFLALPAFGAETLTGKVISIADGDTFTLLGDRRQVKIRLADIDAPERGQPFGIRARQALANLAFQRAANVKVIDTDRYGRTVGHVYVRNAYNFQVGETDVNEEMVRQGFAWAYRKYLRDPVILELEKEARQAGRGLWSGAYSIPPWEWRRGERQSRWRFEDSPVEKGAAFTCGSKRYCREMSSCAEARFYLQRCGMTRLDGDKDGVPCETLCR